MVTKSNMENRRDPLNYKLITAVLLCLTLTFGILMVTGLQCNDRISHKDAKKQILKNIDSLEKVSANDIKKIDSIKIDRKPVEIRISDRDLTIIEMENKRIKDHEKILNDSADVDLIECDRILTGLVTEYKIR